MRKSVLLLTSMALAVLLVGGVALAENITCEPSTFSDRCRGTQEDDTLRGTNARDYIEGLGGIDTIYGRGFPDYLEGGRGNDTLRGEGGRDELVGDESVFIPSRGNDRLLGGPHDDVLDGGPGNDRMSGGPGNDKLRSFVGGGTTTYSNYDYMHGNDGNDFMGGEGELYGEGGDDNLSAHGEAGKVLLDGGPGDDRIFPDACVEGYAQEAIGGPGEDFFSIGCVVRDITGTIAYEAVDGEQDEIGCRKEVQGENVRADPLDTFTRKTNPDGTEIGRQYCESVTIIE